MNRNKKDIDINPCGISGSHRPFINGGIMFSSHVKKFIDKGEHIIPQREIPIRFIDWGEREGLTIEEIESVSIFNFLK